MADLIPDNIRATFFGQRSSLMNIVNIVWFMGVTILLDTLTHVNIFYIYGIIFAVASLGGIADIILFFFVPEPKQEHREPLSLKLFLEPLKNRNFIIFSTGVGMAVFAINAFAPFTSPYITSPGGIGAPNTWLGIMFVISQLTWILVSPSWGLIMDKFGRKPVLIIGCLSAFSNLGYLILGRDNYTYILPLIAISGGLLAPALWDGINQMMLSLTPVKNRTAYVAWNFTIIGLISAGGAFTGGIIKDRTAHISLPLTENFSLINIHFILLLSLALILFSLLILSFVKEDKSKPLKFVVSRVVRPGVFRTFSNMGILGGTTDSGKIARTLRHIDDHSEDIARDDIIERLYDPDSHVREEAALALGRIRCRGAVEALTEQLRDRGSTIRTQAASALGLIGDTTSIPVLMEGLNDPSEDVQNACAKALGVIGGDESVSTLLKLFKDRPDRLMATGAEAVSRLGALEAAWEIIPRMHNSLNPVLTRQLAISIGNLLGSPGEFYKYLTGKTIKRESHIQSLFQDPGKRITRLVAAAEAHPLSPDVKKRILLRMNKVQEIYDNHRYKEAFAMVRLAMKPVIEHILGETCKEGCDEVGALFKKNRKIGLWWWFILQAEECIEHSSKEVLKIDILLSLYFISTFK